MSEAGSLNTLQANMRDQAPMFCMGTNKKADPLKQHFCKVYIFFAAIPPTPGKNLKHVH
jgi:hypothetical protein